MTFQDILDKMPRCAHGVIVYDICPACLQPRYNAYLAARLAKHDAERNGALPATDAEWLAHLNEVAPLVKEDRS